MLVLIQSPKTDVLASRLSPATNGEAEVAQPCACSRLIGRSDIPVAAALNTPSPHQRETRMWEQPLRHRAMAGRMDTQCSSTRPTTWPLPEGKPTANPSTKGRRPLPWSAWCTSIRTRFTNYGRRPHDEPRPRHLHRSRIPYSAKNGLHGRQP